MLKFNQNSLSNSVQKEHIQVAPGGCCCCCTCCCCCCISTNNVSGDNNNVSNDPNGIEDMGGLQ